MATKIFSLLMFLALSASAATATFAPQCSQPPTILPYPLPPPVGLPPVCGPLPPVGLPPMCTPLLPIGLPPVWANPILQPYHIQQGISQVTVANVAAYSRQQQFGQFNPQAIVNPAALQLQQLLQLSQLATMNPAALLQLQQLNPINPLAAVNAVAYLQQQQLQQYFLPILGQLALANPAAYLQQHLLAINQLVNPLVAAFLQPQLALANPLAVAFLQPQLALANPLVAAFLQPQLLPFNQMSWQQPIVGGAIF